MQNITIRYVQSANILETVIQHAKVDIAPTDQGIAIDLNAGINIPAIAYNDIRISSIRSCSIQAHIQYHAANKAWQIIASKLQHLACTLEMHASWDTNAENPFTNLHFHIFVLTSLLGASNSHHPCYQLLYRTSGSMQHKARIYP